MRLLRFGESGMEKPGLEIDKKIYECSHIFDDWNRAFFNNGGLDKLKSLVSENKLNQVSKEVRLGAPIPRPGMIICVGLNYSDHAAEAGLKVPTEPILFMKASNTIAGPYDDVTKPDNSNKMDWEVELGIVIGKDSYMLKDEKEALDAIAGYTIVNDLSEREFQTERKGQWVKGKSCPGFSPTGPYLVTKDEIDNVLNLDMTLSVDDQVMQNGSSKFMVFSPTYVVHYISQFMLLEAGDLISTGTPPGVGLGMKPPRYLERGEVMRLTIDCLGHQKQKVI